MNLEPGVVVRRGERWAVRAGPRRGHRRRFLVKTGETGGALRPAVRRQFAAEYQFLAALDHPGLLRPVALDPDRPCTPTPSVRSPRTSAGPGGCRRSTWRTSSAQAAAALEVVHALKRGHGCIGPAALLVGPAGEVLFAEFAGTPFGGAPPFPDPAPKYLAPELPRTPASPAGVRRRTCTGSGASRSNCWPASGSTTCSACRRGRTRCRGTPTCEAADGLAFRPPARPDRAARHRGGADREGAGRADVPLAAQLRMAVERSGLTAEERLPPFPVAADGGPPAPGSDSTFKIRPCRIAFSGRRPESPQPGQGPKVRRPGSAARNHPSPKGWEPAGSPSGCEVICTANPGRRRCASCPGLRAPSPSG